MKRAVSLMAAAAIVLQLAACSSGGVSREEFDALKQEVDALKSAQNQLVTSDSPTSAGSSTADSGSEAGTAVDVSIHTDDYVDISFIGCEIDDDDEELVFMVNNKTNVELTFQASSFAIDGLSLGHVFGSDSVAAQSKGKIRFETDEDFPTMTPSTLSGSIRVIDFSETLWEQQSYDVAFTNVDVG